MHVPGFKLFIDFESSEVGVNFQIRFFCQRSLGLDADGDDSVIGRDDLIVGRRQDQLVRFRIDRSRFNGSVWKDSNALGANLVGSPLGQVLRQNLKKPE